MLSYKSAITSSPLYPIMFTIGIVALIAAGASAGWALTNNSCGELCNAAFASKYSKIFGIPVGIYAMCAWIWVLSYGNKLTNINLMLISAMSLGALAFLSILTFVIQKTCLVCWIHNISTLIYSTIYWALYIREVKQGYLQIYQICGVHQIVYDIRKLSRKAPVYIAIGALTITALQAYSPVTLNKLADISKNNSTCLYIPIIGAEQKLGAPVKDGIIISLTCPHCYEGLGKLLLKHTNSKRNIALIFKMTPDTQEATVALVAAILTMHKQNQYNDLQKAFLTVLPLAFKHRESNQSGNFKPLIQDLKHLCDYNTCISEAKYVLSGHSIYYASLKTAQTPIYIEDFSIKTL